MVKVEDIQQYGKEHLETVVASATSLQNGFLAITARNPTKTPSRLSRSCPA
jgi:hypothetical protein